MLGRQLCDHQCFKIGHSHKRSVAVSTYDDLLERITPVKGFRRDHLGIRSLLKAYRICGHLDQTVIDIQSTVFPVGGIVIIGRHYKCTARNFDNAATDGNIGQCSTSVEGTVFNIGNTIRNGHALQGSTIAERIPSYLGDPLGDNDVAHTAHIVDRVGIPQNIGGQGHGLLASEVSNQRISAVISNEAEAVLGFDAFKSGCGILIGHVSVAVHDHLGIIPNSTVITALHGQGERTVIIDHNKILTRRKSVITDFRDPGRNRKAGKSAPSEDVTSDLGHTLTHTHLGKSGAVRKQRITDLGDLIGNRHLHEAGTLHKDGASQIFQPASQLNFGQASALSECALVNGSHAIRNHHVLQALAPQERVHAYGYKSFGKRDVCQIHAIVERRIPNGNHTFGDHHLGNTCATMEHALLDLGKRVGEDHLCQQFTVKVHICSEIDRKSPVSATIDPAPGVKIADVDVSDGRATIECPHGYIRHTGRDGYVGQGSTAIECAILNLRHTLGNDDRRKTCTALKGIRGDAPAPSTLLKRHAGEGCLPLERIGQVDHRVGNADFGNAVQHVYDVGDLLVINHPIPYHKICIIGVNGKFGQGTTAKCRATDVLHVPRNGDGFQGGAAEERLITDRDQIFGKSDALERGTMGERTVIDLRQSRREVDTLQAVATIECTRADLGHAIGYGDLDQRITIGESAVTDRRDPLGDDHLFDAEHIFNGICFSKYIRWQGNRFLATKVFHKHVLLVSFLESEAVLRCDVNIPGRRIYVNAITVFIYDLLRIFGNIAILPASRSYG